MKIIHSPQGLHQMLVALKRKNKSIGFVPTMGALHAGHLSLIQAARKENSILVVSIFVNPTQFNPREDLHSYPRLLKHDTALCRSSGVDFIFLPSVADMYPEGFTTFVTVEGLSGVLCGRSRPHHFRGVATIVTKLFNIVCPDIAYFGQKDAQQVAIIKRMVKDLNIPVKLKVLSIVRGDGGLALSSRNIYLNDSEKKDALVLNQALSLAKRAVKKGQKNAQKIITLVKNFIQQKNSAVIDYAAVVDPEDLTPLKTISQDCLLALAVRINKKRLIDNMVLKSK
ncbi:MAG: pantoate--beta-alanine ligase [Candidatus Omnitrophota bacterium]|jgi:pantoate--beta-alanine ligase